MDDFSWADVLPVAAVIVDRGGNIVVANEQAAQLFGYGVPELLTMTVDTLIPESHRAVHQSHRARYVDAPRQRRMAPNRTLSARRADGTAIDVEIALSPVGTDRYLAVIQDTTARYTVERAAQQAKIIELQDSIIHLQQAAKP